MWTLTVTVLCRGYKRLQCLVKFIRQGEDLRVEVNMEHRILRPLTLKFLDGQSLEQFLLTQKVALQRGEKQTLPETSRTAKEIDFSLCGKTMDKGGLVYIEITVRNDFAERLYADGVFHGVKRM